MNCAVGWACEPITVQQVESYGLAEYVEIVAPGDGAALNADLYGAYERGEPWLGYGSGTNDPSLLLELVRLEEPPYSEACWQTTKACAYEDAQILIGVNSALPRRGAGGGGNAAPLRTGGRSLRPGGALADRKPGGRPRSGGAVVVEQPPGNLAGVGNAGGRRRPPRRPGNRPGTGRLARKLTSNYTGGASRKPSPSGRGWGEGESHYNANLAQITPPHPPPSFRRRPESRTPVVGPAFGNGGWTNNPHNGASRKPSPSGRGWGEGESLNAANLAPAPHPVIPAQAGIQNPGLPGLL